MAMTAAVVTLTVAQLLDLGTFIRMIERHGVSVEANPLVLHLVTNFGLAFVTVAKITALSLVVAVTVVLTEAPYRQGHPRLARLVVAVAVIAGIIGGWTNAATLI
jgi:lipoprotein signal peptidase